MRYFESDTCGRVSRPYVYGLRREESAGRKSPLTVIRWIESGEVGSIDHAALSIDGEGVAMLHLRTGDAFGAKVFFGSLAKAAAYLRRYAPETAARIKGL